MVHRKHNTALRPGMILGVSSVILGNGAQKLQNGDDCNDCNAQGVWIKHKDGASSLVVNNSPWSNAGFVLWYISPYQDNASLTEYGLQVAFSCQGIKARRHTGGESWTEWANIFS